MSSRFFFPAGGGLWDIGQSGILVPRNGHFSGDLRSVTQNGGQLAGRRNRIINGGCKVSTRGSINVGASGVATYGGADRFYTKVTATTITSGVMVTAFTGGVPPVSPWSHQLGNLTTTGTTAVEVGTRLERQDVYGLNGKTVTLAMYARQDTGGTITATIALDKANAADDFSAVTALASTTISVPNNTWTPLSLTHALGSSDASNGLQARVTYSGLAAQTLKSWYHTDWMLENGDAATAFEMLPVAVDEIECRRYCWTTSRTWKGGAVGAHHGYALTTSIMALCNVRYPIAMRATPTPQIWNNGVQNQVRNSQTGVTLAAGAPNGFAGNSAEGFGYITWAGTPLTAGQYYDFDLISETEL